jgi:hypothetical protein
MWVRAPIPDELSYLRRKALHQRYENSPYRTDSISLYVQKTMCRCPRAAMPDMMS